ncbi:hypothetical protein COLO4_31617 [Corchorus olitorius]|uniref:Uncharacterized protein n=1 Tax=Corchorus olitorius TaxID=93759 RepID=A0A1R3H3V1_9ROSI|nr:hypothetical protein COLO4_31617 [Corchorus olitorius]
MLLSRVVDFSELFHSPQSYQAQGESAESAFELVQELDKEQTILEAAEAAAKAHKGTMKDDFFGVDVELGNINETVFKSVMGVLKLLTVQLKRLHNHM